MKRSIKFILQLFIVFSLLFSLTEVSSANSAIQNSIVKIYTTQSNPDYDNPWNTSSPELIGGTGCIIKDNLILTNAHVVSNQTFIQVQSHGRPKRYSARVVAVSHDADLALLTVDDLSFFQNVNALELGELPEMQQEVVVYGFPIGGDTLSATKGVISRIEQQTYAHSYHAFLTIQIDAAINPGNSGGPVMIGNKVVGVVMQSLSDGENIGYIVPTPIIKHFLIDLEDGHYDGFPEDGIIVQPMENPGLKSKYGLGEKQTGVLVIAVLPGSPAAGKIFREDVILSVDGHSVADDGTIVFGPTGRIGVNHLIQMHQIGESLKTEIQHDGQIKQVEFNLTTAVGHYELVSRDQYDKPPTYFIYGGLVFMPLTTNYLKTWGKDWIENAPSDLLTKLHDYPSSEGEEVVVLTSVLPATVNVGYHEYDDLLITTVNGNDIHNLNDLINEVERGQGQPFISFTEKNGTKIVLDRNIAEKERDGILKTYKIPSDRAFGFD
jgi:S1-C subfamily serine protease